MGTDPIMLDKCRLLVYAITTMKAASKTHLTRDILRTQSLPTADSRQQTADSRQPTSGVKSHNQHNFPQTAKQTHEPFFTVIVPVYKAETYLEDSIKSVLDQTFGDFELWLIDDGSPDNSGKICDAIASRDSRVHVHHQQNAGPSSARNYGLEHATGQYVCFMDADDRVKLDWLEVYHQHADADILIQGCERIAEDGKVTIVRAADKVYNAEKGELHKIAEEIPHTLFSHTFTKSVRRKLIIDYNVRYDVSIKLGEDCIFMNDFLAICKTVRTIDHTGYYYLKTNSVLTRIKYETEPLIENKTTLMAAISRFYGEDKTSQGYRLLCEYEAYDLRNRFFYTAPTTPRSTRLLAYQWIRKYIRYADFSQYGWRQQVFRLLWLPNWAFDIVLLGITGSCAVARAVVHKGVRRALKKVYHTIRHKEGSAS